MSDDLKREPVSILQGRKTYVSEWRAAPLDWRVPVALCEISKPEIPVTDEMLAAGVSAAFGSSGSEPLLPTIYRAMAAVAPVELVTAHEDRIVALEAAVSERDREITQLRAEREAWKYLYEMAKPDSDTRMLAADEAGSHPYHGPTRPVTDADGNVTGRESVPDPVHERAHGVVGDILAGKVIRPARDQMEKALADAKVKDGKAPPPFPVAPKMSDPRLGGP